LSRARPSPKRSSSTWAAALALAALALGGATDARAQGDDDVVQRPERLTAGVSDQLLGQLAPDGKTLYYVSNRNTTNELYRQEQDSPGSKLVFDEGADVTWPRLSPDGKRILYISFRDDAAGQLCVRDLPDKKRRCLKDAGSAVQAQWIGSSRIALVSRDSLAGNLRLVAVDVGRTLTGHTLVERNLLGPAVSPDGRWLAFDSDRSGVPQIYRVPLAGGDPEQLTTDSSTKIWPRWSPDGREIAYHGFKTGRRQLYLMPAEGGESTMLPGGDGDERTAEWQPDGRGLYYLHNFDNPGAEVRFLPRDVTGRWGAPTTLIRIDALPTSESPDKRWVAFASGKGLMLITPQGDSARVLVPVSYRARGVRPTYVNWAADGRTLYYLAIDSLDRASIWGIDPRTADRKLLVRFDDPAREWHRYGFAAFRGKFYFTLGDRQSDLWTTSVEVGR